MNVDEIRALMAELAPVIKEYVGIAFVDLRKDLDKQAADMRAEFVKELGELGVQIVAVDTAVDGRFKALPVPKDGKDGRDGIDGKDCPVTPEDIIASVKDAVNAIPIPKDGKDAKEVDLTALGEVIKLEVQSYTMSHWAEQSVAWDGMVKDAIALIPEVKDGIDGKDGKDGVDGKDVDVPKIMSEVNGALNAGLDEVKDDVAAFVKTQALLVSDTLTGLDNEVKAAINRHADMLQKAITEIPVPVDGKDGADGVDGKDVDMDVVKAKVDDWFAGVTKQVEDLREKAMLSVCQQTTEFCESIPLPKDGKDGVDGAKGEAGKDGLDGVNLAGMLIDRDGNLQATLSNGEIRNLGSIVGKDGDRGADGFGFEDLEVKQIDDRAFALVFSRDGKQKSFEFSMPVLLDAGVYKQGTSYAKGDGVTYGGSYWIAKQDGAMGLGTPGDGPDWRLAVKKGRDAREPVKIDKPSTAPVKIGG